MRDNVKPLRLRLEPTVVASIPGFREQCKITDAEFYGFSGVDCEEWYLQFIDRALASIGRTYFPILRMFDGEYAFLFGNPLDALPIQELSPRQALRRILNRLSGTAHKSGARQYGWEKYNIAELEVARVRFVESVQKIAKSGALALGLHKRPIAEMYVPMLFDWFDDNEILLDEENYYHFYFVYAWMHGPHRKKLFEGRNVLIVTGLTKDKKVGIERGLEDLGVASVQFLPISSTKAMLDNVDLSLISGDVDVALVGAGVGSANVLVQLEPLETLCIDVGFALSTLADPSLRWIRPFCIPDNEFEFSRIQFI